MFLQQVLDKHLQSIQVSFIQRETFVPIEKRCLHLEAAGQSEIYDSQEVAIIRDALPQA
jgi:hypothetical protein